MQAAMEWRALSSADKALWAAYALTVTFYNSLGIAYHPNWMACYVRVSVFSQMGPPGYIPIAVPSDTGLPMLPTPSIGESGGNLLLTAMTPAFISGQWTVWTALTVDQRRKYSRAKVNGWTIASYLSGLPIQLYGSLRSGLAAGKEWRVFLYWRYLDSYGRLSRTQVYEYDFAT
jgi:hypothetical protein